MKFFTNKAVTQKIIIAIVIVILTTFAAPVSTVQADWGGKLMSPILSLLTAIFDGVQHLLEMAMLGETAPFMKDIDDEDSYNKTSIGNVEPITVDEEIDGSFFGIDAVQIPVITYTPEEIFSNRVPALDVNFITPSIKTGNTDTDNKMNVAIKLQPVISSWYLALRSIAVVGLLSVLIYLGIRMLLTSIAADRAKYKQMLMDWVIAMCLVMTLHYIMAFALTMAETVTAMLSNDTQGTVAVTATKIDPHFWGSGSVTFNSNLMSYVRFMIQAEDLNVKIAFFALYVMLVIFNIRFTWIYLKRVVNMAFLTLMAPMVALTYPIDKVSDGKAQAFNMWLKEFTYNALIQPVDLLLYKILVSSAISLAVNNPLYAVVSLGFIIAAEKLVKKMFGFDKASGGTLGSLAGAAGVTALAGNMLNNVAKKAPSGGGNGKIRTKEIGERQGKDADANKPFAAFKDKDANNVIGAGAEPPPPTNGDNNGYGSKELSQEEQDKLNKGQEQQQSLDDLMQERAELYNQGYTDDSDEIKALNEQIQSGDWTDEVPPPEAAPEKTDMADLKDAFKPSGEQELGFLDTVKQDTGNFFGRIGAGAGQFRDNVASLKTGEGRRKLKNKIGDGINKRAIGAWKALPTVGYKAARGTLRAASRVALAGAMGTMGAIIGATTGDGEKAMSMALGAAGVGFTTGDNLFDASVGKVMPNKSVRDAYDAGKYGNKIDARNARADKEYFRSEKFDDFYDKFYKGKYTKKQVQEFVQDYRRAGITNEGEIRRAKKLEENYMKQDKNLSQEDARAQVQNIVQSYKDMDIDKKAFSDAKVKAKEIERIAGMLGGASENNNKIASQIFRGYEDWRNSAV
ncbi:MAG: hypothetical protein J6A04_05730 [Clostridia bacterium]|nr:hypothetical protein [Clostridia bacterium]